MRLRSDTVSYLEELMEKGAHDSDLAKLVAKHSNIKEEKPDLVDPEESHEKELERVRQIHAQLVSNHTRLKADHQKLIAVTKELTTALELAAKSASSKKASQSSNFTWSSIVLKCGRIYPELFNASNPRAAGAADNRASTSIGQFTETKFQQESFATQEPLGNQRKKRRAVQ